MVFSPETAPFSFAAPAAAARANFLLHRNKAVGVRKRRLDVRRPPLVGRARSIQCNETVDLLVLGRCVSKPFPLQLHDIHDRGQHSNIDAGKGGTLRK
jgi:hypothetical protein